MSGLSPSRLRRIARRARTLPATTWVGIGAALLAAAVGDLSGGFWMMTFMVALVVLVTAAYGLVFGRITWLRLPRKRGAAALGAGVAFVVLIGSASAYGAVQSPSPVPTNGAATAATSPAAVGTSASDSQKSRVATPTKRHTPKPTATPRPTPTPVVTTQLVTETDPIPFPVTTVESPTLAKGTSKVTTAGVNGVETKTYMVTYTDGTETARTLKSDVVTQQAVTQVTTVGTYVPPPPPPPAPAPAAPACTNGTYVNSAGNTVCRPESAASAPSGATAKCVDGTYSFSQTRRGTCSSHGGVAAWL